MLASEALGLACNRSRIMTPSTSAVSPLRQRMLDDMRMRKLAGKTQSAYVRAVYRVAAFLERSPDTATAEDLRRLSPIEAAVTRGAELRGLYAYYGMRHNYRPLATLRQQLPKIW